MDDQSWFNRTAVAVAVAVLLLGVALALAPSASPPTRTVPSSATAGPTAYLNLTIGYNPTTGADDFSASNLVVPSHTRVVVTITNQDPVASRLLVPWDNQVIGTYGGNELVSTGNASYWVDAVAASNIGHTFTIHDALYNISVPIPPAASLGDPTVVSFTLFLNWQETTNWGCVAECSGPGMAADRMYGTLTIA